MCFKKSIPRLRVERLESRWLLAADSICEPPSDQPDQTNVELVAELLIVDGTEADSAQASRDSDDVANPASKAGCQEPGTDDGDVTESDVVQALEEQSIGGEGESSSSRAATLLGQMLRFVGDQQPDEAAQSVVDSPAASDEIAILPPDFQRANTTAAREQSNLVSRPNDATNLVRVEVPRPFVQANNDFARQPIDQTDAGHEPVRTSEHSLHSTAERTHALASIDRSKVDLFKPQTAAANFERQPVDQAIPMIDEYFDLSWISPERDTTNEEQVPLAQVDADEGLMAYLRTIQWPLVPVVAGLAYAVTRSLDQNEDALEPKPMNIRRRWFPRLGA